MSDVVPLAIFDADVPPWVGWLLVLLGAIVTGWFSVRVAKIARGTNEKANENATALTWAQQMETRLTAVEALAKAQGVQLKIQDRVITAAAGYIDALLWWLKTGQKGHMPRPPVIIHDHLDPNLVDVDAPVPHDGPPSR